MKELTIQDIANRPYLVDALAWPFDFSLRRRPDRAPWFRVTDAELMPIACDASGGVFSLLSTPAISGGVLYVSSEGQAGVVGRDLREWLQILLAVPLWVSVLHFSGGGVLEEMRRAVDYLNSDDPEPPDHWGAPRQLVTAALDLPALSDPVGTLHRNVRDGQVVTVSAPDGWQCASLFGTFTVEDNPLWKRGGPTMG